MKIIAWAMYVLAGLSVWTGTGYALRRDWLQTGCCVALALMTCWAARVILEVWA